ncbi:hypothetical protein [Caballeronia insecticola]|uniref:Uncharacterized protein n=1 Tax=Caballeronia insecticola TaxID=758793 RepID=R4X443_9BURK|nr:hypothetical protein [Caballeronia insecticola]BAN26972.1 hypothetical protein BRPE64_DCDS00360 [Caballeronia insecticola]
MKIEPAAVAAASLLADDAHRETPPESATPDTRDSSEPMRYEDLLPYLLLPMAGAY